MARGGDYPPETHKLMSWATIDFIRRPSLQPLAWACVATLVLVSAAMVSTFFLTYDRSVPAEGRLLAGPSGFSAELAVEPDDAALLAAGQAVRHELAALAGKKGPALDGEVLRVSTGPALPGSAYAVAASVRAPGQTGLLAGMTVRSRIVIGRRTMFREAWERLLGR